MRANFLVLAGVAHKNIHEDIYEGYYIPAGKLFLFRSWM